MIICFSGTGNTRRVAQALGSLLGETDIREMTASMLRHPEAAEIALSPGDSRVIWAFPTYSWGVPPVVAELMKRFNAGAGVADATHLMLTTCGDDVAYADRQWRRIMRRRGFATGGAFGVCMPNTYVCMKGFDVDSREVADRKLAAMPDAVKEIAHAIATGGPDILPRLSWSAIKTYVIYPSFARFAMSAKPFRVTGGCTGCGTCSRKCPMDNISMRDGTPQWGDRCALCLKCYHICPRHAIAYGSATEGKGQYILDR